MKEKLTEPLDEFKPRELEIIGLMAEGLSNKEIADQLFITKETVRWYNKQIYSKLGTSRRTEAIALAREMGLLGGEEAEEEAGVFRHSLPVTTGPFIGRNEETAELTQLLQTPTIRLLSIIASGGMGKSRLSLELGHLIQSSYQHGAVFIDLTTLTNPDDIAKSIVSGLGLTITGEEAPRDMLFNYCREKELLLILDNFEQHLAGAALLTDLLEAAPNITLLVTTRERLNLLAETVFFLQPVTQYGAKLFSEVAAMMRPNITIGREEEAEIGRIVELVGGLPLGLILAASWVDTLTISEIAAEIEANLDFLSVEMADIPERQRSIHAVIDPTWKRLKEREQKAFMWAAVFRGGFTRTHFQAASGASLRTVQTLVGRSLIQPGHGRRYTMHPLLRQYARERLDEAGQTAVSRQAHLTTYLDFARSQVERMYTGAYLESLEALDGEQDNFRAALDWSLAGGAVGDGVALVQTLCEFWFIRSRASEAVGYIQQALAQTESPFLRYWLGEHLARIGQRERAVEQLEKAAELAQETADHDTLALTYVKLSFLLLQAKPEEASQLAKQAFEASQILKSPRVVAKCHNLMGVIHIYVEGERADGLAHYEQGMEHFLELGDMRGISALKHNMAIEYYAQGRMKEARECCVYSLRLKRKIGDKAGAARRLTVLAGWDIVDESYERAMKYLTESHNICAEIGDRTRLGDVLRKEGFLRLIMKDYVPARAALEQGLAIAREVEENLLIVDFYSYLGLLYLARSDLEQARANIQKAIETDRSTSVPGWLSIVTYANYLWETGAHEACLKMTAVLSNNQDSYKGEAQVTKYFLTPLLARLKDNFGEMAWEDALEATAAFTVEDAFQEILTADSNSVSGFISSEFLN